MSSNFTICICIRKIFKIMKNRYSVSKLMTGSVYGPPDTWGTFFCLCCFSVRRSNLFVTRMTIEEGGLIYNITV